MVNDNWHTMTKPGSAVVPPVAAAPLVITVPQVTEVLVCGLSCGAPMSGSWERDRWAMGCASWCSRIHPVDPDHVQNSLLLALSRLRRLSGLPVRQRLETLPLLVMRITVGQTGSDLFMRWPQPGSRQHGRTAAIGSP